MYAEPFLGFEIGQGQRLDLGPPGAVLRHQGTSAIVLAVNPETLMAEAKLVDGVIEFVSQVGDFVAVDEPMFNLYGGSRSITSNDGRSAIGAVNGAGFAGPGSKVMGFASNC